MENVVETGCVVQPIEKKHNLKALWETLFYVFLFVVAVICFYLFKPLFERGGEYPIRRGVIAQSIGVVSLIVVLIAFIVLAYFKKITTNKTLFFIVLVGFILRLTYVLYSPASSRQHDTFTGGKDGHFDYAWIIYSQGKLPSTNVYQFYHPPLNAFIQSGFMYLSNLFVRVFNVDITRYLFGKPNYLTDNQYFLYQTCQLLSLFYSFIAGVFSIKILKLFNLKGVSLVVSSIFVMLYPRTIQFAGQLNNDGLSFMLAILSLYFAVRWYNLGKKFIDIILCANFLGLGMCAKLSIATVALPIAGIFVIEFISTIKKTENSLKFKQMALQYYVFLMICASLGLWFQLYAKIRFNQEFGYVFEGLTDKLLKDDKTLWQRFGLTLDYKEWFGSIFCNPFRNYNLFVYLVKCSIFGEFSYWQGEAFGILAVAFAFTGIAFLIFTSFYYIVTNLKEGNLKKKIKSSKLKDLIFIFLLIVSQIGSEIYFYIKMPYGCTMDFRYVMPLILGIGLFLGIMLSKINSYNTKLSKSVSLVIYILLSFMIASSSIFYLVCI